MIRNAIRNHVLALLLVLAAMPSAWAEKITLNLNSADIGSLISTVADATGKNFIIDPRVKGKVTVISAREMDKDELYQVFLSILQVHGFAAVPSGDVIKIVPDSSAKQISTPFASEREPYQGDELVTRVIQVKNVSAAQIVPMLRPLIPQQGHLAAYADTNVLIVSDRANNIERLLTIIRRIDQVSDTEVEIIRLQHASAADVLKVVSALQKSRAPAAKGQAVSASGIQAVADERTNSVILSGEPTARLRVRTIISHLDTPLESTGNTRVIYLRYAKAEDLATVLTSVSKSIEKTEQKSGAVKTVKKAGANDVTIQADAATNALVITAPLDIMASLESVIRKLDIRRAQVLVEAIIAEVNSQAAANLGVQWQTRPDITNASSTGFGSFSSGGGLTFGPGTTAGTLTTGAGFTLGVFNRGSMRVLLNLLKSDTDNNLLSTPQLVTLDNEEAEITVGQNIPILTGQFQTDSQGTSSNPFQTIERQDVGITLKVTPQINEGNAVRLQIDQEVSDVDETTLSAAAGVTTNKRNIKTTVLVDDGDILVLGGLTQNELDASNSKVPLLGELPLLGTLFSDDTQTNRKRNLMVFLKPTILRDTTTNTYITGAKYNYIRDLQTGLLPPSRLFRNGTRQPELPQLDKLLEEPFEQAIQSTQAAQQPADAEPEGLNWD